MLPQPIADVDICLLLEGTYPYVSGGVSTWVHQIVTAFPEKTFGIFFIGSQRALAGPSKYQLPANVKVLHEVYLFDTTKSKKKKRGQPLPTTWNSFFANLRKLFVHKPTGNKAETDLIAALLLHVRTCSVSFDEFFHSPQVWAILGELHTRYIPEDSFLHFYWNCRYLIEPLWKLTQALPQVPKATIYHTACTGYAGFVGFLLAHETGASLLVSEHGIYLKERMLDITKSSWIPEFVRLRPGLQEPLGAFRHLWISFFDTISHWCYNASKTIVSLFEQNAHIQHRFGAPREKITIVPNGISLASTEPLYQQRQARLQGQPHSQIVGFLGRVVPIKDVKTLLRAARLVCNELPAARFIIAGPGDEDAMYLQECQDLAAQLQLSDQVSFPGLRQRDEMLPLFDVMVLTSISEGLPFVALEAMAVGMPMVCTDVGACRDLVNGSSTENPALGSCGFIEAVGDADGIAKSLIRLLSDPILREVTGQTGKERVRRSYHENVMLNAYHHLYEKLSTPAAQAEPVKSWLA